MPCSDKELEYLAEKYFGKDPNELGEEALDLLEEARKSGSYPPKK